MFRTTQSRSSVAFVPDFPDRFDIFQDYSVSCVPPPLLFGVLCYSCYCSACEPLTGYRSMDGVSRRARTALYYSVRFTYDAKGRRYPRPSVVSGTRGNSSLRSPQGSAGHPATSGSLFPPIRLPLPTVVSSRFRRGTVPIFRPFYFSARVRAGLRLCLDGLDKKRKKNFN